MEQWKQPETYEHLLNDASKLALALSKLRSMWPKKSKAKDENSPVKETETHQDTVVVVDSIVKQLTTFTDNFGIVIDLLKQSFDSIRILQASHDRLADTIKKLNKRVESLEQAKKAPRKATTVRKRKAK